VNAPRAFGRSGCPLGRDPATKRYRYLTATVHGGWRAAQREAARLVKEASEGKIPLERETLAGLLERWLDHSEARGRAPKTLLENRRMAAVITEPLSSMGCWPWCWACSWPRSRASSPRTESLSNRGCWRCIGSM
jgi:hypothetical protein